jgi:hypothetical protein
VGFLQGRDQPQVSAHLIVCHLVSLNYWLEAIGYRL